MELYLAKTQGFCAGVSYAVEIVFKVLEKYGSPLYVYHDIVHNTHVVNHFKSLGVVFVESLEDVPSSSRVIFSAHGVPPSVYAEAQKRSLNVIDATCPLVAKVHAQAHKYSDQGIVTILIGHKNHQEMIGTAGYVSPKLLHIVQSADDVGALPIDSNAAVGFVTQTTLSMDDTKEVVDALKQRFPNLISPAHTDLCYATQNRQNAVKELAGFCDVIIICGSSNSSNSNRLRESGEKLGVKSLIVDSPDEFDPDSLRDFSKIGISSGASVPRFVVDQLVKVIQERYPQSVVHAFENPEKDIVFKLPDV